jgi:hypothetical protein
VAYFAAASVKNKESFMILTAQVQNKNVKNKHTSLLGCCILKE